MSPQLREMAVLAERYCQLVETVSVEDTSWLDEITALLARLHASVAVLGAPAEGIEPGLMANLDARFELFSHLREILGERDGYWMEFDSREDIQCRSGSLADDLTDIYCELKHGLRLLDGGGEEGPARVQEGWLRGYRAHWGQHLVDAERHLYTLTTRSKVAV
jgi:hypothetical protein